ncbi:MAG: hydroxymethylpyrimidine/phosphomethylpyrimidine kinase [Methylococcales bacterium]|nr:hydroxymethylpyrimidine/phosphomethylpyrimidine kinase [Methylococcales bacterium]
MTSTQNPLRPVVVSFSGHDPCGGAGIQADIEAITSHHCHAASIVTCLTAQDTKNVAEIMPQNPDKIRQQAKMLLHDLPVHAFKIGLIGHADTAQVIYDIVRKYPLIPVILDPILAAGGGTILANDTLISAMKELLLPLTTVLTPNCNEARQLTGLDDIDACGMKFLEHFGSEYVLITGADEATESVENRLFHHHHKDSFTWARLPSTYHGSGCTLAASIAALLAHGVPPIRAISNAQEYTWHSLQKAYKTGAGQSNPNRFFWRD